MSTQPADTPEQPYNKGGFLQSASADPDKRLEELRRLAAAVAEHEDQSARHLAAAAAAKHAIMLLHGKRGSTIDFEDGHGITWKNPSRSFDKKAFQAAYPPEANEYMYKTETITSLDPEAIPPKLKNQFMRDGAGDGTIIIK